MREIVPYAYDPEPRPIEALPCSETKAREKFEEFMEIYERGYGSNLRVEFVRNGSGIRFVLVGDWEE